MGIVAFCRVRIDKSDGVSKFDVEATGFVSEYEFLNAAYPLIPAIPILDPMRKSRLFILIIYILF